MKNTSRLTAVLLCLVLCMVGVFAFSACSPEQVDFSLGFEADGEKYATITTSGAEAITMPEDPSKEGYTFDGWFWDKDTWEKPFTANSLLDAPLSSDMTVYAKFTPVKYTITYHVDGGTHENTAAYTVEDAVALSDAVKAGYTFLGWYSDDAFTAKVTEITKGTTGDLSLYAKFEATEYTITYEETKGVENTNPATYTIESGTITLAALSKVGYTFDGWFIGEEKIVEIAAGSTENITLTAKWTLNGYAITYHNVAGATNTNPDAYDVEDQPLTLLDAGKTGYRFLGWFTANEGGDLVTAIAVGTTGELNLYARWELITYTATFKADGETVQEVPFTIESVGITAPGVPGKTGYNGAWESYTLIADNITVNAVYMPIPYTITYTNTKDAPNGNPAEYNIESTTITLAPIEKTGYNFDGWYQNGTKVTEIATGSHGNITLEARWSLQPYTITYTNTKDAPNGNPAEYNIESTTITLAPIEKTGYVFDGWYQNGNKVTEIATGSNGDVTLEARWSLKPYTITYTNTKDAPNSNLAEYNVESATITLSPIEKTGYIFDGWYQNGTKVTEITAGSHGNITLEARWTARVYTITFYDADGATVFFTAEHKCGDRIDLSAYKPTKAGKSFRGWYLSVSDNEPYNVTTMPAQNLPLYAGWIDYALNPIQYNPDKVAVSVNDTINAELFGMSCMDTDGNLVPVVLDVRYGESAWLEGNFAAGETVTIYFIAQANGKTAVKTLSDIKVYGAPALTVDDTVDYANIPNGITATHFGASGTDSFGAVTSIVVRIEGDYKAGDIVTMIIESIDPAGNVTTATVENVKLYGAPVLTYNEEKTAISVNDTINAELFGATAVDSFDEVLPVTASCYSGTISAGNTVVIRLTVTDSKGNATIKDVVCKVYGAPTISNATTDFKASDAITPEALGMNTQDTYGETLPITLTVKEGTQTAGSVMTLTATVTDAAGNVTTKEFSVKIYGTPTITYNRDGIKVGEDATADVSILNATAKDSFGNPLTVTATLKSGNLIKCTYVVYTLIATDHLGNTVSIDTAEIGVYDVNDIVLNVSATEADKIKLTSKGEEFYATATDTFGNACDLRIEVADGHTLAGGNTVTLYVVATDAAGNEKWSEPIANIKVYGMPTVTLKQDYVTESTVVGRIFTVTDSFGDELFHSVQIEGEQTVGNIITATVIATDAVGNTVEKKYALGVFEVPPTTAEGTVGKFQYKIVDSQYVLMGYTGNESHLNIPSIFVAIEAEAFAGNTSITSITIPSSVTSIGDSAFEGCTALTSITIPSSVTNIGFNTFSGCSSLESITLPFVGATLTGTTETHFGYIFGASSYSNNANSVPTSLKTVVITGGTSIGSYAFYSCTGLTSITIPSSVTSIGASVFDDCSNLESITLPFVGGTPNATDYSKHFGYIFGYRSSSSSSANYHLHYNSYYYTFYIPKSLKAVVITGGASIGNRAFSDCTGLTSITIPSSVTSIDSYAFSGCTGLTSITIPESVTNISDLAFSGCTGLESIVVESGNTVYHDANNCLIQTASKTLILGCKNSVISIDGSVTSIGNRAFSDCTGLTSITIPSSVTSIGQYAFYNCTELTSVIFEENSQLTSISSQAFYDCSKLTSITIPSSVTSIGGGAFYGCTGVIQIEKGVSYVDKWVVDYDKNFTNIILRSNTIGIAGGIFILRSNLISVTIPAGITSIGSQTFYGCEGLKSVIFEENSQLTSIGGEAFLGCSKLISITIPSSVTSIGSSAFESCSRLTSVIFEENSQLKGIAYRSFRACSSLTSITIPSSVTRIGDEAFYGCRNLTSITIPSSVTYIGSYAFYSCTGLTNVIFEENSRLTSIGFDVFYYCTGLTSITIPASVTRIYSRAFLGCNRLTSITIPASVTQIDSYAFDGCDRLVSVVFENTSGWNNSEDRSISVSDSFYIAKYLRLGVYGLKRS